MAFKHFEVKRMTELTDEQGISLNIMTKIFDDELGHVFHSVVLGPEQMKALPKTGKKKAIEKIVKASVKTAHKNMEDKAAEVKPVPSVQLDNTYSDLG